MSELTDLLVTGCYRSGTTVLEKLLHSHSEICLGSQPFPVLYFFCKERFLKSIGLQRRYPLDHCFRETGYDTASFARFLDDDILNRDDLGELFERLRNYTVGLWTPEILEVQEQLAPGNFLSLYQQLNRLILQLFPKSTARLVGGKEVLVEEYIPYLLDHGVRCVVSIRDPRDMITSLNYRQRDNGTGDNRPVLYSLRVWRKSVAIALAYRDHPNFDFVRYEDVVAEPARKLNELSDSLGISAFADGELTDCIRDQHGNVWQGNSSFDERSSVSTSSVGRFRESLPQAVIAFIEACCFPEMKTLSYAPETGGTFDEQAVTGFRESFEVNHASFPADYSSDAKRVADEIERVRMLDRKLTNEQSREWFLFEETHRVLSTHL